jgi:hypothetical protein
MASYKVYRDKQCCEALQAVPSTECTHRHTRHLLRGHTGIPRVIDMVPTLPFPSLLFSLPWYIFNHLFSSASFSLRCSFSLPVFFYLILLTFRYRSFPPNSSLSCLAAPRSVGGSRPPSWSPICVSYIGVKFVKSRNWTNTMSVWVANRELTHHLYSQTNLILASSDVSVVIHLYKSSLINLFLFHVQANDVGHCFFKMWSGDHWGSTLPYSRSGILETHLCSQIWN